MSEPLVSVIINAYNGAKFLRETIASVYAQSLQDFEIVLFDDASTDATPQIAREFDERLRYARSETQVPLGEARNRAMELARGKYLSFLDQDDLFLPSKLEKQVAAFTGKVGLVFSNSIQLWETLGQTTLRYKAPPPDGEAFRPLLSSYYLCINTVTIRRDALPTDPNWWFPPTFRMCEETDLFLRIAYAHPIAYIDEPLAKYRIHGDNFSIRHREYIVSERTAILERLSEVIPDFARDYAREIAAYRSDVKVTEARGLWKEGCRARAWSSYLQAAQLRPRLVYFPEIMMSLFLPFEALPAVRKCIGRPL